jgi:hypothetical protein
LEHFTMSDDPEIQAATVPAEPEAPPRPVSLADARAAAMNQHQNAIVAAYAEHHVSADRHGLQRAVDVADRALNAELARIAAAVR